MKSWLCVIELLREYHAFVHISCYNTNMKITCAFKYALYVDATRRAALSRNAGCRRFVFNKALDIQNERKEKGEKRPFAVLSG